MRLLVPSKWVYCYAMYKLLIFLSLSTFVVTPVLASQKPAPIQSSRSTLSDRLSETRADLVTASREYKASIEKLLPFEEDERTRAVLEVERYKRLAEGNTQDSGLASAERRLAIAEARLAGTRKRLREADAMIAEAMSGKSLVTKPAPTKVKPSVKRSKPRPTKKLPPGVKVVKYSSITA